MTAESPNARYAESEFDTKVCRSVWMKGDCMLLGMRVEKQLLEGPNYVLGKTLKDVCFALKDYHRICPGCDVIEGIELFYNRTIKHG